MEGRKGSFLQRSQWQVRWSLEQLFSSHTRSGPEAELDVKLRNHRDQCISTGNRETWVQILTPTLLCCVTTHSRHWP